MESINRCHRERSTRHPERSEGSLSMPRRCFAALSMTNCSYAIATCAVATLLSLGFAHAEESLDQLEQKAFRAASERVAPSVVRIETFGGLEKVGQLMVGTGPTSGLILEKDGYIVSSAFNFVHKPSSILVHLADGTRKAAKLIATDHNRKIALLKIDADKPLPTPELAPQAEIKVGQWAIGVGRAFDVERPNMSVGLISATNRIWGKAIQTDAAVSPNNYGGPLVDIRGRVLGILVPLSPQGTSDLAGIDWYDSGIGFAVPAEFIQELLPKLKEGKDLEPGLLGISMDARTLHTAEAVITSTRPLSPAHKAGIKGGDKILQVDDRPVGRAADVKEEISRRYAGDKMRVVVLRDSKRIEAELELVAKLESFELPFLGMLPMRPTGEDGRKKSGIEARWVYPDSPAAKAAIQPGDRLTKFRGEKIENLRQLRAKMAENLPGEKVEFEVRRGEQSKKIEVILTTLPEAVPAEGIPPAHAAVKLKASKPEKADTEAKTSAKIEKKARAKGKTGPAKKEQSVGAKDLQKGTFKLEGDGEVWTYVPEAYNEAVAHGLVIWLHGSEGVQDKELTAKWKPLCDRYDLILVAPKADGPYWRPRNVDRLRPILVRLARSYSIDPHRVVVAGRESGGSLACLTAFSMPSVIRGVVTVDGPLAGHMPEEEPPVGLPLFIARSEKSRSAAAIKDTISRLKEMKCPVTIKELGPQPRELSPDELSELARWIDALDRI